MDDTMPPYWAIKTERGWFGSEEWTSVPCASTHRYSTLEAADEAVQPIKDSYKFVQIWRNDPADWTLVSTYRAGGTRRYARAQHHDKPVEVADRLERVEAQPIEATAPSVEEFFKRRKLTFEPD